MADVFSNPVPTLRGRPSAAPVSSSPLHPCTSAPLHAFSPAPDQIDTIIHELCDPTRSMLDIADIRGTTIAGLSVWMTRPEIAERLSALESAIARRTRLVAACHLPASIEALSQIVSGYIDEETHVPISPNTMARETARKASFLLIRLARFQPANATASRPPQRATASPLSPRATASSPPWATSSADHPTSPAPNFEAPTSSRPDALPLSLHELRA